MGGFFSFSLAIRRNSGALLSCSLLDNTLDFPPTLLARHLLLKLFYDAWSFAQLTTNESVRLGAAETAGLVLVVFTYLTCVRMPTA